MVEIFARDFHGEPFEVFGIAHLTALGLVAVFIMVFIILRRRISQRADAYYRYGMAGGLLLVETSWHLWNILTGQWTIQRMLPLHLCSVMLWLSIVMLLSRCYPIYEFAYLLGIAGALQALLTPDIGSYGFPHFRFFQTMASHGLLVSAPLYMTIVDGMRPTWGSVKRVMLGGVIYMAFIGLVNRLVGSNYLFIAHKPDTVSLLDILPPWPFYIPIILGLGMVFILLFYLPFALGDRILNVRNRSKSR